MLYVNEVARSSKHAYYTCLLLLIHALLFQKISLTKYKFEDKVTKIFKMVLVELSSSEHEALCGCTGHLPVKTALMLMIINHCIINA